jgi:hypothetical protein
MVTKTFISVVSTSVKPAMLINKPSPMVTKNKTNPPTTVNNGLLKHDFRNTM